MSKNSSPTTNVYIGMLISEDANTPYWAINTTLKYSGILKIALSSGKFSDVAGNRGQAYMVISPWKDEQIRELTIFKIAIRDGDRIYPIFPEKLK